YPISVVSLMDHRPCVSLHDHRQPFGQRFANTAGTRFPDEEIGELHIERDFSGESLDEHRDPLFHGSQLGCDRIVSPAEEKQLYPTIGAIQSLGDLYHFGRALSAE